MQIKDTEEDHAFCWRNGLQPTPLPMSQQALMATYFYLKELKGMVREMNIFWRPLKFPVLSVHAQMFVFLIFRLHICFGNHLWISVQLFSSAIGLFPSWFSVIVEFSCVHIIADFWNNFQDHRRLPVCIFRVKMAAVLESLWGLLTGFS